MKNRIQQNEITTVCCVCGGHISGPWPARQNVSHSYCALHYRMAMKQIEAYFELVNQPQPTTSQRLAA
jgi:rRNA maturation protein Nop10